MRRAPAFLAAVVVSAWPAFVSAAAGAPPRLTSAEAEKLVREISARVEEIRGLKFKTPVSMKVISGAEARENFKSKIDLREAEAVRHLQYAYIQLGLIPRGADLLTGYLNLAEKDVAGFYEPGSKMFYLLDHVSLKDARATIAHELTHALEDQHYDLRKISSKAKNDDHQTAITAIVEGSATAVMLAFLGREDSKEEANEQLEKTESRRAERLRIAPSFTQRSLMLPYLLGFSFLLRGKPWEWVLGDGVQLSDIDAAYKNPPHLTRQILHPEQYWTGRARHEPQLLQLPDLSATLGKGWSKAAEGSIGELGLAVLTGSRQPLEFPWAILPSRWTNDAATGSVGDVFHHYAHGDCLVTILLTRWESLRDAEEFERALVSKGRYAFRYGANFILISGDIGDKGEALAIAAMQSGRMFWPTE